MVVEFRMDAAETRFGAGIVRPGSICVIKLTAGEFQITAHGAQRRRSPLPEENNGNVG
jgi:hypothetical protein